MKNVLITGPTGAVGVSLINELIENGIHVTAVCRPNSKRINAIPHHDLVDVVECSLDQLKMLGNRLTHDYDVFYHCRPDLLHESRILLVDLCRSDQIRQPDRQFLFS